MATRNDSLDDDLTNESTSEDRATSVKMEEGNSSVGLNPEKSTRVTPLRSYFIREVDGNPKILWKGIGLYLFALLLMNLFVSLFISYFFSVPLRRELLILTLLGPATILLVVIELQRQQILHQDNRIRFSIASIFIGTFLVAIFAATVITTVKNTDRRFKANKALVSELEIIIGESGGNAYIGSLEGGNVTLLITRADFSDDDFSVLLGKLKDGTGATDVRHLDLGASSITEKSLESICKLTELRFLNLPFPLSKETLEKLKSCRAIEILLFNNRQLTTDDKKLILRYYPKLRNVSLP